MKKGFLYLLLCCWNISYLWDISPYERERLIDVIIPCIDKDRPILEACIQGIKTHFKEVRRVIVISPTKLTENAEWFDEKSFPFSIRDVGDHLCQTGVEERSRCGWFLQQLLKFYAPFTIPDLTNCILVLDADTIFLRPFSAFSSEGKLYFDVSTEYWLPYFEHMNRLHPSLSRTHEYYSGISHHMIFDRAKLEELFELVESYHQKPFWQAFLHSVAPKDAELSGASEYEIYFNYCLAHHGSNYTLRALKHYNNALSLDEVAPLEAQGYQAVSCHSYQRSAP